MNQSVRILHILATLSNNKITCTKQLVSQFHITERTAQRDMEIIKEFLSDALLSPQRGCYQLIDSHFFSDILSNKKETNAFKELFEFLALFNTNALKFLEDEKFAFFHKIQKESNTLYSIFESPIEELTKSYFLEDIKFAIKHRHYCDILYHEKASKKFKNLQPQKILYAKNNWYLAVMTERGDFKRLRINFIESITLQSKTFHTNLQAQEHIKKMQSLFQDFDNPNYEVQVKVDYEVSRYFRVKKYLSSQKIIKEDTNGDLILSFQINNDMEIIPLIKMWIPHLKVISPLKLDDKIKEELSRY